MNIYARLGVGIGSIALGAILLFLLYFSFPLISGGHTGTILSARWNPAGGEFGLLPMVMGTLWIALGAAFLAAVMSLSIALTIDALPDSKLSQILYRMFMLFGSIPTVVYGFVGVLVLVPYMRQIYSNSSGMSVASAALVLAFVITPTMILFFLDSFRATPRHYRQMTAALGGETIQYQLYVMLPYHIRSIKGGFVLGFARAMGDTMIALMIAGNSIRIPHSFGDSARTLTAHIALLFGGDFDSPAFRSIFASGLILFVMSLVLLLALNQIHKAER
jgi:phosphate transport system permease protein